MQKFHLARISIFAAYFFLLPCFTRAADISWDDGAFGFNKDWSNAANWDPDGTPAAKDVFIGDLSSAAFDYTFIDQDYAIDSLTISSGADADTDGNFLDIAGDLTLSGSGTSFVSREHGSGTGTTSLDVYNITVNSGGAFQSEGGRTIVAVPGPGAASSGKVLVNAGGVFSGYGTLRFQDGLGGVNTTQFTNNGQFLSSRAQGSTASERFTLLLQSSDTGINDARVDLDGTNENGAVILTPQTTLDVNLVIADTYHGVMSFAEGSVFDSFLPWNHAGTLNVDAASTDAGVASTATLRGGAINFQSGADVNVNSGTLVLDTAATLSSGNTVFDAGSAITLANANTGLQIDAPTVINGDINVGPGVGIAITVNEYFEINDDAWNWSNARGTLTTVNQGALLRVASKSIGAGGSTTLTSDIAVDGGDLSLNIEGGWELASTLSFTAPQTDDFSSLTGTPLLVDGGTLHQLAGPGTAANVSVDTTFTSTGATIAEPTLGNFVFPRDTVFQGGSSHTGAGSIAFADMRVDGDTTFDMPAGTVNLDIATALNQLHQLNADLTINAAAITNEFSANVVGRDGSSPIAINLNNANSRLTVNLTDPADEWTLGPNAELNITAPGSLSVSLAGSDLNIDGVVTVLGSTQFNARIDLEADGVVNLPLATSKVRLFGGGVVIANTINGGEVRGAGELGSFNASLTGHGDIFTDVNFTGLANLVAQGGTLTLHGDIVAVNELRASGAGSVLQLPPSVSTGKLRVDGGLIRGSIVVNNTLLRGHGVFEAGRLINNATIQATTNRVLELKLGSSSLLDGSSGNGELEAIDGDIAIEAQLSQAFNGQISVGQDRTLTMSDSWTLGPAGVIQLTSPSISSSAIIETTGSLQLNGHLQVAGHARLQGETDFGATATVDLPSATDRLSLSGSSTLAAGATFTGSGNVGISGVANQTIGLTIEDGFSSAALNLGNSSALHLDDGIGQIEIASYEQFDFGIIYVELAGTGAIAYDQLNVAGDATLAGSLHVSLLGGYTPTEGDLFTILTADTLNGEFFNLFLPTLSGDLMFEIEYDTAGNQVLLEVVGPAQLLFGDADNNLAVSGSDLLAVTNNFGNTGPADGLLLGDADDNGSVSGSDLLAVTNNFGATLSALRAGSSPTPGNASPGSTTPVPEPATCWLLIGGCGTLAWRGHRCLR